MQEGGGALCDLSVDNTAAKVELQVLACPATSLNYPIARTFFLDKMLEVHYVRRGLGV